VTKQEAMDKTVKRFTNLLDGKILSGVSVSTVIEYYEALMRGVRVHPPARTMGGIEQNFFNDQISAIEEDLYDSN
jgi:hypothetical protein